MREVIRISTLNVENVSYTYQSKYQLVHALKEINCSFSSGKFHVIEGRSGSGKTTLLSLLAGLDFSTEGNIYLDGISYREMDRERLRREQVSIIFQTFNLFPLLTALENVMYPVQLIGKSSSEAKNLARDLIHSMGLGDEILRKYPTMLSGGEQQRVAIARALASGAKIILADEPTGNLDTQNGELVVSILKELVKKSDYCVILVTHDRSIVQQADIVYRMQDGVIV